MDFKSGVTITPHGIISLVPGSSDEGWYQKTPYVIGIIPDHSRSLQQEVNRSRQSRQMAVLVEMWSDDRLVRSELGIFVFY